MISPASIKLEDFISYSKSKHAVHAILQFFPVAGKNYDPEILDTTKYPILS